MNEEIKKTKKSSNKKVKKQQPKKEIKKVEEENVVVKKNTSKKTNTSKKQIKNTKSKKVEENKKVKVEVKKEEVRDLIKEEDILVKEEVVIKKKKKSNNILLIVLGCIILFLLLACVVVRKWYLPSESYSFDYLNMRTIDYIRDKDENNKLVSENNKCIITVTTEIVTSDDKDLSELGIKEEIRKKEWVRQDFENGVTWITYYKDMLYIVQMYAVDNDTYNDVCKKDFDNIKKTFSFLKSE